MCLAGCCSWQSDDVLSGRTTSVWQHTQQCLGIIAVCRTVLRVQLTIEPTFEWRDRSHGGTQKWHIWVEDSDNEHIYHSETWLLTKKMMREPAHRLAFTIPIFEPLPPQYYVR